MLSLLEAIDVEPMRDMRLYVADADRQWWDHRRAELGLDGCRYAVLAPTARWASKRWPIERWRELIEPMVQRGFERLVVIGAPGESKQIEGLAAAGPGSTVVDLVGQTTIARTMAIIAASSLVVANDSAPLHIAVGFDRPCVALFGPTDPAIVGPYRRPGSIVTARSEPCQTTHYRDRGLGDDLMRLIAVSEVIERVDAELAECETGADRAHAERAAGARP
jgi:ADP-heptose:LPS heptosyltransferase